MLTDLFFFGEEGRERQILTDIFSGEGQVLTDILLW